MPLLPVLRSSSHRDCHRTGGRSGTGGNPPHRRRTVFLVLFAIIASYAYAGGDDQSDNSPDGTPPALPEALAEDIVMEFIDENDISTVEALIDALPPLHKQHFVAVWKSESPSADFISTTHPRIVSWGADSSFIVTWTTDPGDPETDSVEFLQPVPEQGRWIAGAIDFSGEAPILRHPSACAQCHGDLHKPLWGDPEVHEGTEEGGRLRRDRVNGPALYQTMLTSTHPRLTPLERDSYNSTFREIEFATREDDPDELFAPNWEFAFTLLLRHSEVLFNRLKLEDDYLPNIESILCSNFGHWVPEFTPGATWQDTTSVRDALLTRFGVAGVNIRKRSDTFEPIQGENATADRFGENYRSGDTDLFGSVTYLIFHDLWQRFPIVRELYRQTSNLEAWRAGEPLDVHVVNALRFPPPAEATAEDELVAGYRDFFELRGQTFLDERALLEVDPQYSGGSLDRHALIFHPRVCSALKESINGGDDGDDGGGGGGPGPQPDPDSPPDPEPPPPPPAVAPTADFTLDAPCNGDLCRALTGKPVAFVDTSSGNVAHRTWDFGNGSSAHAPRPSHAWSSPGFYPVSLTVSDGMKPSTKSISVLVEANDPAGSCLPDAETLCLQDSRYEVRVRWRTGEGATGEGATGEARVVHSGTNDSGLFSFFDRDNWEVLIKVLDGCSMNGNVWVFGGSTTDIGYSIVVTDTATGSSREYRNEPGQRAPAITDARAFPDGCE